MITRKNIENVKAKKEIIPLRMNFMAIQIFYSEYGIKFLEYLVSDLTKIPYEKIKDKIKLRPRNQQNINHLSAETEVDILIDYQDTLINIEINNEIISPINNNSFASNSDKRLSNENISKIKQENKKLKQLMNKCVRIIFDSIKETTPNGNPTGKPITVNERMNAAIDIPKGLAGSSGPLTCWF